MSSQTPEVSERSTSHGQGGSTSPLALLARHPLSAYYLLMGSALLLLLLGLIMVMSASSIESVRVFGSPYTLAQRQAFFALLGVVAMFFAARTSVQFWRAFAWPLLLVAFGLLVAVLIIGVEVAGQRNWIEIFGPFRLQPPQHHLRPSGDPLQLARSPLNDTRRDTDEHREHQQREPLRPFWRLLSHGRER